MSAITTHLQPSAGLLSTEAAPSIDVPLTIAGIVTAVCALLIVRTLFSRSHLSTPSRTARQIIQKAARKTDDFVQAGMSSTPLPASPNSPSSYQEAILRQGKPIPESVNYHFLRQCNYECRFCFHTYKSKDVLPDMRVVFETLRELHKCGMRKINFSGGEPFLQPKRLAMMVKFCKVELSIAVSIVTNGSLLKETWLKENASYIDYIALSCDSYDEDTSIEIGRTDGKGRGDHVTKVRAAAAMIHKHNIRLRVNSVINRKTLSHNFHDFIEVQLAPVTRWKVFQMLLVEGENTGEGQSNGRDATDLVISDEEFAEFVSRHKDITAMKVESNATMANSYVIVDERLRFLDTSKGSKIPSRPIPEVGVVAAYVESEGFDQEAYLKRDGRYEWERTNKGIADIEDLDLVR